MFPYEGLFGENSSWTLLCNNELNNEGVTNHNKVTLPTIEPQPAPAPAPTLTPIPTPTTTPPRPSTRKRSRKGKEIMVENDHEDDKICEQIQNSKVHILTERERRKKMKTMFTGLHSLLPQLSLKADKSSIVEEAVNQIISLESTLERLQKEKQDRAQGGTKPNSLINNNDSTIIGATSNVLLAMVSEDRETFMADKVSKSNSDITRANSSLSSSSSSSHCHQPVLIQTWTSPNVVLNICGVDAHFSVYAPKKQGMLSGICQLLENYKLEVVTFNISSDAFRCNYSIQARVENGASEVKNVEGIYKQAAADIMLWISS